MLTHSRVTLAAPDRLFIGGQWVKASSGAELVVVNPTTEENLLCVAEAQAEDVANAVSAAREAFDRGPWPRMSHGERAGYLLAIAEELDRRSPDLSDLWSAQMGILHSAATATMPRFGGTFRTYAALADEFPFEERLEPTLGGKAALLCREPVGVVGAIIAWNGPVLMIANKVAPALLAGCTVVLKASPEAPGEAYVFAEAAEAVGLPPGVVNVVAADREASEALVRDPRVDKITFTGSTAAGRRIGSICGERIARVTLELGGKSAAVVFDDYDPGTAAASLTDNACAMTGQVCASLTRVIVTRHRHAELVAALREAFAAKRVGDPFDPASDMGPLAMRRQYDRVRGYIERGVEEGGTLVTGGRRPGHLERGFFLEPTLFAGVDNSSTIAREEIFGPVLCVIPADDEDQAIEIANDTMYGLNNSVYTNDVERALHAARRLRSGTVGHNAKRADLGIAVGGFKQSGLGREGGREGLLPFLELKTIILDAEPGR
jgi:acyl-CoA reductase-like NAD-dependent aldehyde dehydrogenase